MRTVVIAAHGCPVWPLGAYGNEWIATPHLDRLAAEGVTFDRHFAKHPDPLGGRADWWGLDRVADTRRESATLIRASRPAFDAPSHYYARFAEVFDARPKSGRPPFAPLLESLPRVLDTQGDDALLWIETDRLMPPWFSPADVFQVYCEDLTESGDEDAEPLTPWSDPPVGLFDRDDSASWELLHRSFAAAVTTFDADVGRIFELLQAKGWDQSANWVFTSDFGYPLGHHGLLGPHRPWLYEELVHIPLILRRPGGEGAGERVWAFTQPEDVVPLFRGGEGFEVRGSVISVSELNGHREAALRTDTYAFILPLTTPDNEPRQPQLYEKPNDRWELNDIRQPNLGLADELEVELRKHL